MVIEGGGHESILGISDVAIEKAITPLFQPEAIPLSGS
jgi:hypothetical protein